MLVLMLVLALVILSYKFRFIQYITKLAHLLMVKSLHFTHTRYYTLYYSTIGSALIIAYRSHYRIHSRLPCLPFPLLTQHEAIERSVSRVLTQWLS